MPDPDETAVDQTAVHEPTQLGPVLTRKDWGADPGHDYPAAAVTAAGGFTIPASSDWPMISAARGGVAPLTHYDDEDDGPSLAEMAVTRAEVAAARWRARREILMFGLGGAIGVELVVLLALLVVDAIDGGLLSLVGSL